MTTKEILSVSGVRVVLEGAMPGKDVVIVVGIHGNETCGMQAVENLLPTLNNASEIVSGRVTFVYGNLRAIDAGVRFVEQNLNRLFRIDDELTHDQKASYEYERSRELMPLFKSADALLDIHSSGTKDTVPFVICNEESMELAKTFPFPIVSYGWDNLEPGGTDDFVIRHGKIGLCVECGYHNEPGAIERAEQAIQIFLRAMGCIEFDLVALDEAPRIVHVHHIHKTQTNFTPARYFPDFEKVVKGELVGIDGDNQVHAANDGVVIFVRNRQARGEEAFILGSEIM